MISGKSVLVRDSDAADMLELLFVVAVATILINRAFLALTGYPRIAFGHFHIAHMLWGGLLMLISIVMLVHYWNPSVRRTASLLSGIGFGLFIDELGKFITKDNDYFFQPTIAIIYVIFVVMYLSFRKMTASSSPLSGDEMRVNSAIREQLGSVGTESLSPFLRGYYRTRERLTSLTARLLAHHRVIPAIMVVFALKSIMQFVVVLGIMDPGWMPLENLSGISLAGALVSDVMVITGLLLMKGDRMRGLRWFKRAVLLNIFVTQVFLFYQSQLTAIWGLGADLAVYAAIDYRLRMRIPE